MSHHHHHHHGEVLEEDEVTLEEKSDGSGAKVVRQNRVVEVVKQHGSKGWWLLACFVLFLFILIFFYIAAFDNTNWNNGHHMHQLDLKLKELAQQSRQSQQYVTTGLYSMGAAFTGARREFVMSFCHQATYRPVLKDKQQVLVPADPAGRAAALAMRAPITALERNYVLSTHLEMRYNVPVDEQTLRALQLSPSQHYQTLHYEVASDYAHFSTIRLVVTTEDIYRAHPRLVQDVLICSNRPGSARRCSQRVSLNSLLRMNNTLLMAMEAGAASSASGTRGGSGVETNAPARPRNTAEAVELGDDEEEQQEQQGVDLVEQEKESLRLLESQIANNRLFHVLFYREVAPLVGSTTTSRDAAQDEFHEYLALTVAPVAC